MKGRYPRLIVMFPGIMVLVRSEEQHRRMRRNDLIGVAIFAGGLVATAGWLAYVMVTL